jgi:hypothetical protein
MAGERLKTFSRDVRFAVLEKADEDLIHERSLEVQERAGVSTTNGPRRERRARPDPRRLREGRSA